MRFGSSFRWNASFDEMTCSWPSISLPSEGAAAGRDQDMLGAHRLAGRDEPHGVRVVEHRAALDDRRPWRARDWSM